MNKVAFVDTTILVDALLKPSTDAPAAKAALASYDETLLPAYALKEFKAGALRGYRWFHNSLVTTGSLFATIHKLQKLFAQANLQSSALDAFCQSAAAAGSATPQALQEQYGAAAAHDAMSCDMYRLAVLRLVLSAWRKRRTITSKVVNELNCYTEIAPEVRRGLIEIQPTKCSDDCCLATIMKGDPTALQSLRRATDGQQPRRKELDRRSAALKQLIKKPKTSVDDGTCRDLGDAVFAFFAPPGSTILTTNVKDHAPLAASLNKTVSSP